MTKEKILNFPFQQDLEAGAELGAELGSGWGVSVQILSA